MHIKLVHIQNYHCIFNEKLELGNLTSILGVNGAGKSTFLRAISLFYSSNPTITVDDFFNGDTSKNIVVSITYTNMSSKAKEQFAKYSRNDELTVEMVINWKDGKKEIKYHGSHLQNQDFNDIYHATKTTARELYNGLRKEEGYKDMPDCRNYDEVIAALQEWEKNNPEKCIYQRDDGSFFGFKEIGRSYLLNYSKFLFISAVRDASQDTLEGKGSVITELMDLVIRGSLSNRDELVKFKAQTQEKYEQLLQPVNIHELNTLSDKLTKTLQVFIPDSGIDLNWQPLEQLNIPMPKARISLVEDGFSTKVEMTGHGLQRALIFTILQHLALAQHSVNQPTTIDEFNDEFEIPSFIIAIEEPELYQHPNRQRHFGSVLRKLANGDLPGIVNDIQIVCATHSPLFVDISYFEEIRIIRKTSMENFPMASRVSQAQRDQIISEMKKLNPSYTDKKLQVAMESTISTLVNEGFFADVVVIVEGESDQIAIFEVAKIKNINLEAKDVSVIHVDSKSSMIVPSLVFSSLGIPTYLVWDMDANIEDETNKKDNKQLFNFLDYELTPDKDLIENRFAVFYNNREFTMEEEVGGDLFNSIKKECKRELGIDKLKKITVLKKFIQLAYKNNKPLISIEQIVENILNMRNKLAR